MTASQRRALIVGVNGQDGALLAKHLVDNGYEVIGTSRDAERAVFENLDRVGIRSSVRVESLSPTDFQSVLSVVMQVQPDEIYNLSGQSSVGLSFAQPVDTLDSNLTATVNFLEAIRFSKAPIRFYSACSTECFGNTGEQRATEDSAFRPRSPYATSKASAFWMVANYRESYGLFACSGILSNHESELRSPRFVTQKIVRGAVAISAGLAESLTLGDLSVARDWGWADEYVVAMQAMLQSESAEDYIIATGHTRTLSEFVDCAFECVGLRAADHVQTSADLHRPSELNAIHLDPSKARRNLGWSAKLNMADVVARMVAAERQRLGID